MTTGKNITFWNFEELNNSDLDSQKLSSTVVVPTYEVAPVSLREQTASAVSHVYRRNLYETF